MLAEYFRSKKLLYKAIKLYRVNCNDYGYAESCLEYGTIASVGVKERSVKSDPVEALKYFEKGCKLGSSENCLKSGMLLISPRVNGSNLERDLLKVRKCSNLNVNSFKIVNQSIKNIFNFIRQ